MNPPKKISKAAATLTIALAVLGLLAWSARAAPGDLDSSFGAGGKVTMPFNAGYVYADPPVVIQSDGKILVAINILKGDVFEMQLMRYTPEGLLDAGFGSAGRVNTNLSVRSLALQSDGKIVVAGSSEPAGGGVDFAVARYLTNGNLDPGFGDGGKVTTNIGGDLSRATARGIAFQRDGKVVVAGHAATAAGNMDFALVRYNTDGSLDASFGSGGKVITGFGDYPDAWDYAQSVAIQRDGKILLAGWTGDDSPSEAVPSRFALARYNSNGSLDDTFGEGGKTTEDLDEDHWDNLDKASSIAVADNGKILVAGSTSVNIRGERIAVVRYLSNGRLDTGFGSDGLVIGSPGVGRSVVLQKNGKIVVTGSIYTGSFDYSDNFIVLRYTESGAVDTGFGITGTVTVDLDQRSQYGGSAALQGDGKIVIAGSSGYGSDARIELVRCMGDPELALEPVWFDDNDHDDPDVGEYILLGTALPGSAPAVRIVTVRNVGSSDLTLDSLVVGGTSAADFSLNTTGMVSTLGPNQSTSFALSFSPGTGGVRYATLSIFGNGAAPGPRIIDLAGGLTPLEIWRFQWFGWPTANLDFADQNNNGIVNLLEYALGGDPVGQTTGTSVLPRVSVSAGNALQFSFTRWLDRTDLSLTISAADAPTGPWIPIARSRGGAPFVALMPAAGITETGGGNSRSVTATDIYPAHSQEHPNRFMRLEVAR